LKKRGFVPFGFGAPFIATNEFISEVAERKALKYGAPVFTDTVTFWVLFWEFLHLKYQASEPVF